MFRGKHCIIIGTALFRSSVFSTTESWSLEVKNCSTQNSEAGLIGWNSMLHSINRVTSTCPCTVKMVLLELS